MACKEITGINVSNHGNTVVPLLEGHPWGIDNLALLKGWRLMRGISDTIIHDLFSGIMAL